ncbi:MAG: helix-hairpin-helix domain-containing protein, partial [Actinobacteria bacterium]|nr:helix-hairpin-helix domain-containing protein [Actinomycetota bacterium]
PPAPAPGPPTPPPPAPAEAATPPPAPGPPPPPSFGGPAEPPEQAPRSAPSAPAESPAFGSSPPPAAPSPAAPSAEPINLNSVTFEQLRAQNLSVTQATRLLAHRERLGGFASVDDLDQVAGFPQDVLADLKSRSTT